MNTVLQKKRKPRDALKSRGSRKLRGEDLNLRPSGYEPDELPDCSTPLQIRRELIAARHGKVNCGFRIAECGMKDLQRASNPQSEIRIPQSHQSHGAAQLPHLAFRQHAVMTRRQLAEGQRAEPHAAELLDRVADALTHAAHFALAAFTERDL